MPSPRRIIAAVLLVFALAFSTAAPASAMSVDQAKTVYLHQVCATGPLINQLNTVVFRGNRAFQPKKMHGKRLRQTRRVLVRLARVERDAALRLINPPSAWPTPESEAAATAMGRAMLVDRGILNGLRTRAGARFVRYWRQVLIPHDQILLALDKTASDALGIPADATC